MLIEIRELPYDGANLKLLGLIHKENNLYRACEKSDYKKIIRYGTNRAGFKSGKKWEESDIPYEDVMFATTADDIIKAEANPELSSSFKKFQIYKEPILVIYNKDDFEKVADRQWKFKDPSNKKKSLKQIVFLNWVK